MKDVYQARITREVDGFVIEIPELEGLLLETQHSHEVEEFSRRMIAEWMDIPEDSFSIKFISESAIAL